MIKIETNNFLGHGPIKILYPGTLLSKKDTGLGSIGRIDHALFSGSNIIRMHPHINDEILTYLRSGYVQHEDSEGFKTNISKTKLMLMKAGKLFYHEETIIDKGEDLEGLQIFIRPGEKDLKPAVDFWELDNAYSENEWRLIASPTNTTKFKFSSESWIYDVRITPQHLLQLPELIQSEKTCLLYVFNGKVKINDETELVKKEGVIFKNETISIESMSINSDLVLFVTDESTNYFDGGMYSGNQTPHL